jgi:hypothetical protein
MRSQEKAMVLDSCEVADIVGKFVFTICSKGTIDIKCEVLGIGQKAEDRGNRFEILDFGFGIYIRKFV